MRKEHLALRLRSVSMKEATVLAQLIQSYARTRKLGRGRQLHAHFVVHGGLPSAFLANHLLNMYAKCGDLHTALALFDAMPHRNLVTWTALISGFAQNARHLDAVSAFGAMCASGVRPNEFALSSAVQASASLGSSESGRQLHCVSLKLGCAAELFVGSNLADMYSKCGSVGDASRVFDEMPCKDGVSWTAMIDGYAKNGDLDKALLSFAEMFRDDLSAVDQHALCAALSACGSPKACSFGRSLHACLLKLGLYSDTFVANALVDMYAKAGDLVSASQVVRGKPEGWNVVSCSSLIDGYAEADCVEQALRTYVESRRRGIEPNEFTFSSLIKACAADAVVEQGAQFHAQVIKNSLMQDAFVSSSLIDMYGECGLLKCAVQVFDDIEHPSVSAWNVMLGMLAQHGHGEEAVEAFEGMISRGFRPNDITFINLLTACSHSGLVEQGLRYFHSMSKAFDVEPRDDHFSCVIDMLGRAGRLKEAKDFISQMPFEPNAHGWCSLLGACRIHGDKELGEIAAEKLMKLEPDNSGIQILLSSIYASVGRWDDMREARKQLNDSRVKKLPGFSWVDVNKETHAFGSDDSHWQCPQDCEV